MLVKKVIVGPFQANCYIIADEKGGEGIVIDPGGDVEVILDSIKSSNLNIIYIIATHAHIDHIAGVEQLKKLTGAKFLLHFLDAPFLEDPKLNLSSLLQTPSTFSSPEKFLQEGEKVKLGKIELEVIHTPGHTPGSISLIIDECVFTGDTLFAGGIGRVDFPGGHFEALQKSIREKIFSLPSDTKVFPGHGPETTVEKEKKNNPFV